MTDTNEPLECECGEKRFGMIRMLSHYCPDRNQHRRQVACLTCSRSGPHCYDKTKRLAAEGALSFWNAPILARRKLRADLLRLQTKARAVRDAWDSFEGLLPMKADERMSTAIDALEAELEQRSNEE